VNELEGKKGTIPPQKKPPQKKKTPNPPTKPTKKKKKKKKNPPPKRRKGLERWALEGWENAHLVTKKLGKGGRKIVRRGKRGSFSWVP